MKSSMFIAATSAVLAVAAPLEPRVVEIDWVVDVVTVTVDEPSAPTAGPTNTPDAVPIFKETTPSSIPAPPPAPPAPTTVVQPSPVPSPTPGTGPSGDYANDMLKAHNDIRAKHSATALTWDTKLAQYAQTIAQTCDFKHDMSQGGGGYGQNIAAMGSSDSNGNTLQDGLNAVNNQWYTAEEPLFNGLYGVADPTGSNFEGWGHFTQIVWKGSSSVGCFSQPCAAGTALQGDFASVYTVCNYAAAGNMAGQFAQNVSPRSS